MIYLQLFFEFLKVGLFAVGGGMATFPFLTDLADKTGWYTQQQLIDMIAIAESTPGPIGVNTATYVGFTTAGLPGALIASLGLITPSVIIILIIARVLARFKDSKLVQDVFYGLRPASTGLIAAAGFSVVLVALTGAQVDSLRELVGWQGTVHWPSILLAAVLLVLTRKVKQTKDLHRGVYRSVGGGWYRLWLCRRVGGKTVPIYHRFLLCAVQFFCSFWFTSGKKIGILIELKGVIFYLVLMDSTQ